MTTIDLIEKYNLAVLPTGYPKQRWTAKISSKWIGARGWIPGVSRLGTTVAKAVVACVAAWEEAVAEQPDEFTKRKMREHAGGAGR